MAGVPDREANVAKGPSAKRYAKALFDLARDEGKLEPWMAALRNAVAVLDDPTVSFYFSLPKIPMSRKLEAIDLLARGADPTLIRFLGLLASRQAISLLPDIMREYGDLLDGLLGRVRATATTAVPLSKAQQDQLRKQLRDMLEKDVVLEARVDESIIGGIVVRVGDQVIDGSVRTKLERLKQRLAEGSLT
jgi:F-type H+-transporting ATPase subunit delta